MVPPPILVVDDDRLTRWSIARQLERAGYRVLEAASGEAALAIVSSQAAPALVLLDLGLPGMHGFAVLAEIRKIQSELPIITMTTDSTNEVARRAKSLGANAHLEKPFDAPSLTATINSCLESRSA